MTELRRQIVWCVLVVVVLIAIGFVTATIPLKTTSSKEDYRDILTGLKVQDTAYLMSDARRKDSTHMTNVKKKRTDLAVPDNLDTRVTKIGPNEQLMEVYAVRLANGALVPGPSYVPRLRHSRHLDPNQLPMPSPSKLAVMDNHKPIIKDCSGYKPTIKEEGAMGAFVTQIKAIDPDPPHAGGTLEYRFVTTLGEKERFKIVSNEGSVFTADIFDHDEPSREKEVYITVRVSDNGIPQLDDTCTIRITIEDINDNAPVFDKVSYTESVPADLELGREVMRISATDIDDGNNSIVRYALDSNSPDHTYFHIDSETGVIFLNKTIDKPPGYKFRLSGIVKDMGTPPLQSSIALDITVIESNRKRPTFDEYPREPLRLNESFQDYSVPIATVKASSNIPGEEDKVQFELVQGQTEQTNKWHTFVLVQDNNIAVIKLASHLDYERITDYTLTIRIQNSYRLAAEKIVDIEIIDQNDMIPVFTEIRSGTVLENEPPGTFVMQVTAIDGDASPNFRNVTYSITDPDNNFAIDPITGNITTLRTFDREVKAFYHIKVIADDGAESANVPGTTNSGSQVFLIEIADKNDNAPKFGQHTYVAESIAENANINELVTQVNAVDVDAASVITYSIVAGNTYDAFTIRNLTGEIRVNSNLDYENITNYSLDVRAFDGIYEDYTKVLIQIENLNDNPPVFLQNYTKVIEEERLYDGCIIRVEAYDPDIPDRNAPQNIVYSLVKLEQKSFLDVDNDGCLRLTKPLDRDQPTGFTRWQVLIMAADAGGKLGSDSLRTTTEVILELTDINDNAPFLTNVQPVFWMENDPPGLIVGLIAKDYDSEANGPPFSYSIPEHAGYDIVTKFQIRGTDLYAVATFDREMQKEYFVPIAITDSGTPRMMGISSLHIVIGDRNDNSMTTGHANVVFYNFKGLAPDTEIGRVYVTDPDDWDVKDKKFSWLPSYEERSPYFDVHSTTGMVTMKSGTPPGTYQLKFNITEESPPNIPFHWVIATVNVTVKEIPEEAVDKSGSIRFINVTAEEFITPGPDGISKMEILHRFLVKLLNVSYHNIDIFTIVNRRTMNNLFLDLRFAAHGSPYYSAEKLDAMVAAAQAEIEAVLGMKMYMVHINECLFERELCEDSCRNVLIKNNVPVPIFTNISSFIGVNAYIEAECSCQIEERAECLNGGKMVSGKCECLPGFNGPHCEGTSIGFSGDSWAMYPAPEACQDGTLSFTMTSHVINALVFFYGPLTASQLIYANGKNPDFMALELNNGYPVLHVNYGSGTTHINNTVIQVGDGKPHLIEIVLMKSSIEMFVDRCKLTTCMSLAAPTGTMEILNANGFKWTPADKNTTKSATASTATENFDNTKICLRINGPLQLGGTIMNLKQLAKQFKWEYEPTTEPFFGCITNLTYNEFVYDLSRPSFSKNVDPSCTKSTFTAVTFGIDSNFLVAILVCCAILIILLLAVVVHRRRAEGWAEKELDDIRENIIAYEDEGGGEGDAGYDLHVLRQMYDSHPPDNDPYMHAPGRRTKNEERSTNTTNSEAEPVVEVQDSPPASPLVQQSISNVSDTVVAYHRREEQLHRPNDLVTFAVWHEDDRSTRGPSSAGARTRRRVTFQSTPYDAQQIVTRYGPQERISVCNTPHCQHRTVPQRHPILPVRAMPPVPPMRDMPVVVHPSHQPLHARLLQRRHPAPPFYRPQLFPEPHMQNVLRYDGLNKRVSESGLPACLEARTVEPVEVSAHRQPHRERMFDDPSQMDSSSDGMVGATPDISEFLDDKKTVMDRDPETPFDDVRHYAYEGDGNTSGSLSSLASCTDDGDLKFNYLSTFGPRFRKLADMYGDTDEERSPHHEESWC